MAGTAIADGFSGAVAGAGPVFLAFLIPHILAARSLIRHRRPSARAGLLLAKLTGDLEREP